VKDGIFCIVGRGIERDARVPSLDIYTLMMNELLIPGTGILTAMDPGKVLN